MRALRTSIFLLGLAALGGCATGGGMFGDTSVKPKTIVVTDFAAAPEVDAIDRGFSARMDRNGSTYPILERKRRTLARVNDEIVATIVVTLREAGLEAEPGSEEGLTLNDKAAVVSGRLRGGEGGSAKKPFGFGPAHIDAVADMTVSYASGGSRKQLTAFTVAAKEAGKLAGGKKEAVARNAEIAAVLAAEKAAPERLSPDVEAQARRLGRAVGEKVAAYAKEQGWIEAPAAAEAPEEPVKPPQAKPAQKPQPKADKPAT
ncbi:MAG TPA: hypothetical protein VFW22_09725 [Pseudolabrys sp.]|nr:hypothetical protein [Pseudolabrys sp.]